MDRNEVPIKTRVKTACNDENQQNTFLIFLPGKKTEVLDNTELVLRAMANLAYDETRAHPGQSTGLRLCQCS